MIKWYDIKARANAAGEQSAEVFIFGDIGESWWGESVTAASFVKEVAALDVSAMTVRINSYGGSVSDGLAIYNALRRHKATVTTAVDGVAMSIASLIAMAGDEVEMAENAILMIHAPWGGLMGNSKEMREYADVLDKMAGAMATSYAARSGKSVDDMLALLTDGADHYYTAAEALAEGFATATTPALAIAASAKEISQPAFWAARAKASAPAPAAPAPVETIAAAAAQPEEKGHDMSQLNQAA
ncbi:MAG: head maturation protease, ClpP-related, partial [Lysobacter sp.]